MDQFQPYPTQGGGDRIPPGRWSLVIPLWMLKISSNFMTLFLWTFAMSHWCHFSKKKFEILKNWNFFGGRSDIKGPFEFFFKIKFFHVLGTNHTFSTWILILHVLSFLLRYITWVLVQRVCCRFWSRRLFVIISKLRYVNHTPKNS